MKRRDFCTQSLIGGAAAMLPFTHVRGDSPGADLQAIKLSGAEFTLGRNAVRDFAASLNGIVLAPGQEGYNSARRMWNAMIDKRPALIARCANPDDVMRAVTFARENQLLTAVRGGGHSFPGYSTCDGGMMIDLSLLRAVRVDAKTKVARVEGGAWVIEVDGPALREGLATTMGQISNTGIGGLTLGGGFGWLSRRFGLACDNLLAVDLVTADGKLRHVSAQDAPDLFWALRGGGGNFGVATAFEYRMHSFNRKVLAGHVRHPITAARDVIDLYANLCLKAPRELSIDLGFSMQRDQQVITVYVCHSGDLAAGEKLLEPLTSYGKPLKNTVGPQDYQMVQTQFDGPPLDPENHYIKGGFVREFTPAFIDVLINDFKPSRYGDAYFQDANGAVADVATSASAFSHRDAVANLMLLEAWLDPAITDERRAAVRTEWAKLERFTDGYYVNLNDATPTTTDRNYGANFARLATIKKQYDPMNLFRLNANVKPAA